MIRTMKQFVLWAGTIPILIALGLAGCTTDRSSVGSLSATPPARPAPPPVNMAGRWTLSSPGSGLCGMTFTAPPNAVEGKIRPEGGCPGNFFTSRGWAFQGRSLVIRDHNNKDLASLAPLDQPGGFAGTAVSGIQVTLTR